MLIRSQDKIEIINMDNVTRIGVMRKTVVAGIINDDIFVTLGRYSSDKKAMKVLDMIQSCYETSLYSDHGYDYSAKIQRPYIFANNKTFIMPQEDEI